MEYTPLAPPAHLTLRAHSPAPARIELASRPVAQRFFRAVLWLVLCWGPIPILLWIPPYYPWAAFAFAAGITLAYRDWSARFNIYSFAGICPRCGSPLALGPSHAIDLPHTLTCFSCHFEPRLEVRFAPEGEPPGDPRPIHQNADCVGAWTTRWLADSPFLYCENCHAGVPATPAASEAAEAENLRGVILEDLTDEGKPLL